MLDKGCHRGAYRFDPFGIIPGPKGCTAPVHVAHQGSGRVTLLTGTEAHHIKGVLKRLNEPIQADSRSLFPRAGCSSGMTGEQVSKLLLLHWRQNRIAIVALGIYGRCHNRALT